VNDTGASGEIVEDFEYAFTSGGSEKLALYQL
jgi:hypothetical protein